MHSILAYDEIKITCPYELNFPLLLTDFVESPKISSNQESSISIFQQKVYSSNIHHKDLTSYDV